MTIYYKPHGSPEPDPTVSVDFYEVWDGEEKLGEVNEPADNGMPDSIGGVAPDTVRELVTENTPKTAYEVDRRTDFIQGEP